MLRTSRLHLRPFRPDDLEAIQAYAGDFENLRYMVWGPNDEAATRAFLDAQLAAEHPHPRRDWQFAVELAETGRMIGGCGITVVGDGSLAEVGWVLHRDHHRRGYGTEICHELLRFGFVTLGVHRIVATCRADNVASYRVMEHAGMRREAHFRLSRRGRPCDPEPWYDQLEYGILESEWRGRIQKDP